MYKNLNRTITRQSLSAHDEVVEAYKTKEKFVNLKKSGLKKPANLNYCGTTNNKPLKPPTKC